MAFSPDGKLFASTSGSTFKIWDTATWQPREHNFQVPRLLIGALTFDPKAPTLLAIIMNERVLFWDTTAMKEKFSLKEGGIGGSAIALTADGNTLASGAHWGDINLWDVPRRKFLRHLGVHKGKVHSLLFTADGKVLVSASSMDGTIRLWDVAKGKELTSRNAGQQGKSVTALAASPDGKTLVSGDDDGIVKVWDLAQLRG
jgi:WD40 repeat protein